MKTILKKPMQRILAGVLMAGAAGMPLMAQSNQAASARRAFDLAITYDAVRNGGARDFWLQGGSAQFQARFWRGLGAVAELGGMHTGNMHGSGVGLDLITVTFGPRYTLPLHNLLRGADAKRRISLYGQALGGVAEGFNSVFPAQGAAASSDSSYALQLGGGVDCALGSRFALRAVEIGWMRTALPNNSANTEDNLRIGTGIVYLF